MGNQAGQRIATGIYTWAKPKTQEEKNHNAEALAILEAKKSQLTLEQQCVGTNYIPAYKLKTNFIDYYSAYADANKSRTNRHLRSSLIEFKKIIKTEIGRAHV